MSFAGSRARHFVPHAVILLAIAAGILGAPEPPCLAIVIIGHLAVPLWSAVLAIRSGKIRRELGLGLGTVVGVHAFSIACWMIGVIGGHPEDTWLAWMMIVTWLLALLLYVAYALLAFFLTLKIADLIRRGRL